MTVITVNRKCLAAALRAGAAVVEKTRNSEEIVSYRVHREAQKKSPHYQRALLKRAALRRGRETANG